MTDVFDLSESVTNRGKIAKKINVIKERYANPPCRKQAELFAPPRENPAPFSCRTTPRRPSFGVAGLPVSRRAGITHYTLRKRKVCGRGFPLHPITASPRAKRSLSHPFPLRLAVCPPPCAAFVQWKRRGTQKGATWRLNNRVDIALIAEYNRCKRLYSPTGGEVNGGYRKAFARTEEERSYVTG